MTASFRQPGTVFRLDADRPTLALVTGAAGGLGARVALALAGYGADVARVDVLPSGGGDRRCGRGRLAVPSR